MIYFGASCGLYPAADIGYVRPEKVAIMGY
jgi:hypothetical protein